MDQIKNYELKVLNKKYISGVKASAIVALMESRFPQIRDYFLQIEELALFYVRFIPIVNPNMVRLTDMALFAVWIYICDVVIQKDQQLSAKIIQVIDNQSNECDSPAERFFVEVIRPIINKLDGEDRPRILSIAKQLVESMSKIRQTNFDQMTAEQYLEFFKMNNSSHFHLFCIEYGMGISFGADLRISMKKLVNDFSLFVTLSQDLFAYRSEEAFKHAHSNYVSIKMRWMKYNFEECIGKVIVELDQLERQINQDLNHLLISRPGIDLSYSEAFSNFMNVFVHFHKAARCNFK